MPNDLKIREKLPVRTHVEGKSHEGTGQAYVLRVDGLVGKPLNLTLPDLEKLHQQNLTHDFTCLEGWTVPGVKWKGVLLETVLSLANAAPQAHYVQASAGEFSVPLPREAAAQALLAIHLEDAAVPHEHGGPVRLVVPGGDCFTNIKWLDHLELRSEPGTNTAKKISLARLDGPQSSE